MRLFKRRGYWHIELPGEIRRSLKTKDEAKARRLAKKIETMALEDRLKRLDIGPGKRISEFTQEYLAHREATVAHTTVREDQLALKDLLDCFGDLRMERLDRNIENFRAHVAMRFTSPWTRNKVMRHVKTALKYAKRRGYCSAPLEDLKAFPVDMSKPIYLERHEVRAFIAWAKGEHGQIRARKRGKREEFSHVDHVVMGVAVPVMFYTGISRAEITGSLAILTDKIQFRRKKTGKLMTVPVADGLWPHIEHLPRGLQRLVPWQNPRTFSWHFRMIAEAAGLPHMTPHKVRHTFATLLLEEGQPLETVSELLGHSDISVTMRFYAHITDRNKKAVVDTLRF